MFGKTRRGQPESESCGDWITVREQSQINGNNAENHAKRRESRRGRATKDDMGTNARNKDIMEAQMNEPHAIRCFASSTGCDSEASLPYKRQGIVRSLNTHNLFGT